jgi:hypothetical protein
MWIQLWIQKRKMKERTTGNRFIENVHLPGMFCLDGFKLIRKLLSFQVHRCCLRNCVSDIFHGSLGSNIRRGQVKRGYLRVVRCTMSIRTLFFTSMGWHPPWPFLFSSWLIKHRLSSKRKHGAWDPMSELTRISSCVDFRVDSNTCTMGFFIGQSYARFNLNPMPESTLSPSQGLRIWPLRTGYIVVSY